MWQMRLNRLSPLAGLCACLLLTAAAGNGDVTVLIQSSVESHAKVLKHEIELEPGEPDPATAELNAVDAAQLKVSDVRPPANGVPPLHVRQMLKRKRTSDERRRKVELKQRWDARQQRERVAREELVAPQEEREQAQRSRVQALEEQVRAKAQLDALKAKEAQKQQKQQELKVDKAVRLAKYEQLQKAKVKQSKQIEISKVKRERDYKFQEDMKERLKWRQEAALRRAKVHAASVSSSRGEPDGEHKAMYLHLRGPRPHPPLLLKVFPDDRLGDVSSKVASHFGIDPTKVILKLHDHKINKGDGKLAKYDLLDGDVLEVEAAP